MNFHITLMLIGVGGVVSQVAGYCSKLSRNTNRLQENTVCFLYTDICVIAFTFNLSSFAEIRVWLGYNRIVNI